MLEAGDDRNSLMTFFILIVMLISRRLRDPAIDLATAAAGIMERSLAGHRSVHPLKPRDRERRLFLFFPPSLFPSLPPSLPSPPSFFLFRATCK